MTPLAQYLAKQLVARPKDRKHSWSDARCIDDLREWLSDIHCFEVSEVNPLIGELTTAMHTQEKADEIIAERRFLPAPKHGSSTDIKAGALPPFCRKYPKGSCARSMAYGPKSLPLRRSSVKKWRYPSASFRWPAPTGPSSPPKTKFKKRKSSETSASHLRKHRWFMPSLR